ncbi:MAG TPA: alanine racemase [Acidimicrobiales bacterium]|nr:alanine racemase [Acidimicrobiales bacterium]
MLELREVLDGEVDETWKGMPAGFGPVPLREIGNQGWNVLAEELPLPLLVLKESAVEHNLRVMADFCAHHRVLLAPHGKTTMAPQLFQRQLDAGCWGVTAGSVEQLQVMRRVGVPRVILANQAVGKANLAALAGYVDDPRIEVLVFVDSVAEARDLAGAVEESGASGALGVLAEVGYVGGRTGARSTEDLVAVAEAIDAAGGRLRLSGVAGFEGLLPVERMSTTAGDAPGEDRVAAYIASIGAGVEALRERLPDDYIVSAGGSAAFDAVIAGLRDQIEDPARLILRSGCYITHDDGMYSETSPLQAGNSPAAEQFGALRPAFEVWAYVQSVPEPGLAILTCGRRDVPFDYGLPVPLRHLTRAGDEREVDGWTITNVNDQHAYMALGTGGSPAVGDRVVLGISHPCTAFDKWRLIPVVDDAYNVIEAIRTYF